MMVQVYSLRRPVYEKETVSVTLQTVDGEITILDNHLPLVTLLGKGQIRLKDMSGKEDFIDAESGFVEVRPKGDVNILLD